MLISPVEPAPGAMRKLPWRGQVRPAIFSEPEAARMRRLEALVARTFGVRRHDLRARPRGSREVQVARQVALYLTHVVVGLDYTACGQLFGRDRTTAAHACRRIEDLRDDPRLDAALSLLEAALMNPPAKEHAR